ncbi:patj homolog isoform X2 [Cylas formicarius]|uniref:patj homolog isoform X2 n=1 Tax=Cylas formicarius TaxID=197179 RepID=UPI002958802B|nr:patj homolog isoform X2 [Cylas formicarius]
MVLSTEWSQVEVIDLVNDGSGLGFGGIADKDSRLQSGDHILQIGDINLRGLSADQVATVLRQAGSQVRMVVARPIEPTSADIQSYACTAPIVPTKILTNTEELDRQLLQNGYSTFFNLHHQICNSDENTPDEKHDKVNGVDANEININNNYTPNCCSPGDCQSPISASQTLVTPVDIEYALPETKRFSVVLKKNEFGLGITVAGYVCEREDLNGLFVKNLTEGSEAYKSGEININDRIIEVNGQSLLELTNHEAVKKLKETGESVYLTFERYLRGPKFEQLREVLASHEPKDLNPSSPSVTTLSWIPIENVEEPIEAEGVSVQSVNSDIFEQFPETKEIFIEENFEANPQDDLESSIKQKWEGILGEEANVVVANLTKLKGLGISLEGTVDVEGGVELRPRHFIRSILPEGPVGQNGKLSPGDELLEVNGQKLLGLSHVEVVKLLRELPTTVRLVCSRKEMDNRVINTSQDLKAFEQRNILGGSLKNLLPHPEQRLVKALSDTSLHTSSTITVSEEPVNLQKAKSHSLEMTNVALWSEDIEFLELQKADRGLGFSILDYQDPLDVHSTIIVIRSLVPNGPAEIDGRITPGDRLISVNGTVIKNFTLDQAVQVLKGTLPGIVKLGISKPLPVSRHSETVSNNTGS